MANNPIRYTDPNGDIIPQLIGGLVGGVVNVVDQALKGNITSFGEGLAYFGNGAAAGVAVSFGQIGLARGITVAGNKGIQYATGKFDPSGIDSWGDVAGLALDVGTDMMTPGLTNALSKPLTKSLTARAVASTLDDFVVQAGDDVVRAAGEALAYNIDEFVVVGTRISNGVNTSLLFNSLKWGKNAIGHLVKHRGVLGYGNISAQQAQKMIPYLKNSANNLLKNADPSLTRIGQWHQHKNAIMHISNGKMIVTKYNGEFITAINKTSNNWYKNAIPF